MQNLYLNSPQKKQTPQEGDDRSSEGKKPDSLEDKVWKRYKALAAGTYQEEETLKNLDVKQNSPNYMKFNTPAAEQPLPGSVAGIVQDQMKQDSGPKMRSMNLSAPSNDIDKDGDTDKAKASNE